jgi:hypothetical protein
MSERRRTMVHPVVSPAPNPYVDEIDEIEGKALVDKQARKYLGMSAEEFAIRYEAGDIPDPDRSQVIRVAILLPFMKQSVNGREHPV